MSTIIIIAVVITVLIILGVSLMSVVEKEKKTLREDAESYKLVAEQYRHLYESAQANLDKVASSEYLVRVEYCTSNSDQLKYKTQSAMENAILSRLAVNIGHEVEKLVEKRIVDLEEGNRKYSYTFKVRAI